MLDVPHGRAEPLAHVGYFYSAMFVVTGAAMLGFSGLLTVQSSSFAADLRASAPGGDFVPLAGHSARSADAAGVLAAHPAGSSAPATAITSPARASPVISQPP